MATFQAIRSSGLRTACARGLICCIVLAAAHSFAGDTALVSSLVTVVFKADQKPVGGALVELRSKEKVLDQRRTDEKGTVGFSGLDMATRFLFTARRSGYRRTYLEANGGDNVMLELVKKYGPPVREME